MPDAKLKVVDGASEASPNRLTIEQLAQESGLTVRNIRSHQARGLLPPPEVRARTGFYGPEHVARVELIKEMQADGFNLEAIRRLLESSGGATDEVLRCSRAVTAPFEDETPEIVELAELADNFGGGDPEALQRAIDLGLLRPLGEDRFEQRSPRLARAARELRDVGVAPGRYLEVAADLRRHADGVAKAFVQLFLDEVWKPFDEAGRPPERWPEIFDALERLRPLAAESMLAVFQIVMTERVERALGKEIEWMAGGGGREEPQGRPARPGGRTSRVRSRGR